MIISPFVKEIFLRFLLQLMEHAQRTEVYELRFVDKTVWFLNGENRTFILTYT